MCALFLKKLQGGYRMPDYKRMYYQMIHVTEEVIGALIAAQHKAEEIYVESSAREREAPLRFVVEEKQKKPERE